MLSEDVLPMFDWWHTIEVAAGVVTPGGWDLRATAGRLPWPVVLAGMRCLDLGTMDGFWACELEHRGAAEVVAIDVLDATVRSPKNEGERAHGNQRHDDGSRKQYMNHQPSGRSVTGHRQAPS